MRRALIIAARLLDEAEPTGTGMPAHEAPRGAVYVIHQNEGRFYPSFEDYARQVGGDVDGQIAKGVIIVHARDENNITVYSKAIPVPVSTATVSDMIEDLGVWVDANTGWSKSVTQRPAAVDWGKVFASQKYMDQTERERGKMDDEIERDQEKEQKAQQKEQPKGSPAVQAALGATLPPPERRHNLDIGFMPRTVGGDQGVEVGHIYPNSAAAKSGLEVGDIIRVVGAFRMSNGEMAPREGYRIRNPQDLQRVLGWLAPGDNFPMKVVRGDQWVDVVLTPTTLDWEEPQSEPKFVKKYTEPEPVSRPQSGVEELPTSLL